MAPDECCAADAVVRVVLPAVSAQGIPPGAWTTCLTVGQIGEAKDLERLITKGLSAAGMAESDAAARGADAATHWLWEQGLPTGWAACTSAPQLFHARAMGEAVTRGLLSRGMVADEALERGYKVSNDWLSERLSAPGSVFGAVTAAQRSALSQPRLRKRAGDQSR